MQIGDKVQFTKVVRERWVLKAKTGQTGIIKNIDDSKVNIEISNGNIVETTIANIKLYEKREKLHIAKITNEELVDRFEMLIAHQWQTANTKTKAYAKMLANTDKVRTELLIRLNKDQ